MFKKYTLALVLAVIVAAVALNAQIADPVQWKYSHKILNASEIELRFEADIAPGYDMYGAHFDDGGPVRTNFIFEPSGSFKLSGKLTEVTRPKEKRDPFFDNMLITLHSKKAVFIQVIKVESNQAFSVSGQVEYMACTGESCLPPVQKDFTLTLLLNQLQQSM